MTALRKGLATESEALDEPQVLLLRAVFDVIQQLAALGNHGEQAAAGREILLVDVQVVRQVEDPFGEEGHLVRGAAGVTFVELIVFGVDFVVAHIIGDGSSVGRTVLG